MGKRPRVQVQELLCDCKKDELADKVVVANVLVHRVELLELVLQLVPTGRSLPEHLGSRLGGKHL